MTAKVAEIRVKGKNTLVPCDEINGQTVIVTGKWIKTASIQDEESVEGEALNEPDAFVAALKQTRLKADILTFFQRPPDVVPKFKLHFDWDNYAAVPVTTFEDWWENRLPQEARKNTRRAAKRGVTVRTVPFDDELVRGIQRLCNETPVRQGRPFWHYGKDFETIKREHATFLERSEFIGAFYQGELIGFIKLVFVDQVALIFHILALNSHYDKRPINALLTKAMEVCVQRRTGYFVYGKYVYGNKTDSSLVELKRRTGFEQVNFPRYYVPLTLQGRVYVALRLYRGLVGLLPGPILKRLLALRDWLNEKRGKSSEKTPEPAPLILSPE